MAEPRNRTAPAAAGEPGGRPTSGRRLRVSVAHGDLAFVDDPVVVGHYEGDTLVGAEGVLDRELKGRLSRRRLLGRYPGPVETSAVVLNEDPYGKPRGAIVIGLGKIGELSPGELCRSFAAAASDYALQKAEDEAPGAQVPVRLVSLLIGTGGGFLSVDDSIGAMIDGALQTNAGLVKAGFGYRVRITEIRFLELYLDQAILACRALRRLGGETRLSRQLEVDSELYGLEGGRRRVTFDEAPGWWRRLRIEELKDGSLQFTALTDRARAPVVGQPIQSALVDGFVAEAVGSANTDPQVASSLFELLIPNRLKQYAPDLRHLVLVLDEGSAAYPWELLEDGLERTRGEVRPPAVRAGMIRQLETPVFREVVTESLGDSALVVGDPKSEFRPLPQAKEEAKLVAAALEGAKYSPQQIIGEDYRAVIRAIFDRPYRVLHLAGHGVYRFPIPAPDGEKTAAARYVTGMVLGGGVFLTPAEIEKMRHVPDLVFLNCCYLGKIKEEEPALLRSRHGLAANVSTQLIEMGVRAVVAAGWAVDDAAALTFAGVFYEQMLAGARFGSAVLRARRATWEKHRSVNTWGAYQCYGDPDFVLRGSRSADAGPSEAPVAAEEVLADLENLVQIARTASDAALPGLARWAEQLEEAAGHWGARADLRAALGQAWGQLDRFDKAIEHYEAAVRADKARFTVEALEQLANLRSRWAVEQGNPGLVDQSLAELRRLPGPQHLGAKEGRTVERLCLLGSAYKRRALISGADEDLKRMVGQYRRGHKLALKKSGKVATYPLLNWLAGQLVLFYRGGRRTPGRIGPWLDQADEAIAERSRSHPDFWNAADEAQSKLLRHLASKDLWEPEAREEIVKVFRAARRRGSPREFRSVLEHLDWMVRMLAPEDGRGDRGAERRRRAHEALAGICEDLKELVARPS